jgi:SAM-dependent methyltransferase
LNQTPIRRNPEAAELSAWARSESENEKATADSPALGFPSADEIRRMPYVKLLALLGESNRPPGGIDTVRRLIVHCHLGPETSVLHAGCNAGFLSRELVRLSKCRALGIDLSPEMAAKAQSIAEAEGLADRLQYRAADMRKLPFADGSFDVTLSGGALAFVEGHEAALAEWIRVTRRYGLLADAELFYRVNPPGELRGRVSELIGVRVPEYDEGYWRTLFSGPLLEPYYFHVRPVHTRTEAEVEIYVRRMTAHCAGRWSADARGALHERLLRTFLTFNENLSYMSYLVAVVRCLPEGAEPALYA